MTGERGKRISDRVFKKVEQELYQYPKYQAQLRAYPTDRTDVLLRYREWPPPEGHAEGELSDRTSDGAIRLRALDQQREWAETMIRIIEAGFDVLGDAEQELVRLKYWSRDEMTNEQVFLTMRETHGISRRQWYRMREDIVILFAELFGYVPKEKSA